MAKPPSLSDELLTAYQQTDYIVYDGDETITLKVGQSSKAAASLLKQNNAESAVFITAWNPFSESHDDTINAAANKRLFQVLQSLTAVIIEGEGISADKRWREASYFALRVSQEQVKKLCLDFDQTAAVFVDDSGTVELLFHSQISSHE